MMEFKGTDKEEFARRIKGIIIARFILYGLALMITHLQMIRETLPPTPFFLYITLVIYGSNIIFFILTRKRRYLFFVAYLSLFIDLLAITLDVLLF